MVCVLWVALQLIGGILLGAYVVRRVLIAAFTIVIISFVSFVIIQLPDRDVTDYLIIEAGIHHGQPLSEQLLTDEEIQDIRHRWGLDRPLIIQWADWVWGIARGDWGYSLVSRTERISIKDVIADRLLPTVSLMTFVMVFTWVFAIPVGIYSAVRQHSVGDYVFTFLGFSGLAVPDFLLALLLMYVLFDQFDMSVGGLFSGDYRDTPWNFARIVESIGLQVIRALMLLIAFIPILWGLSSNVVIPWLKDINGSLVYISLIASLGGVLISWLVGIKLPGLEYNNQVVEAAFRKELVYGEDDRVEYAKPPTILELFTGIKFNYHRLFLHYGYFDLWLIMYNQSMIIVPYIIMGPGLFTGAMTLGILIQTSSAFREVQGSFSLFMQNWTRITELRSIFKRLNEFEKAIGYKNADRPSPDIVRS